MSNVDPNQPGQQPGWQQQPGQPQPGWQQQPPQQQPQPGWQQPPQQQPQQPGWQQPGQPQQPGWQQPGVQSLHGSAKKSPLGRLAIVAALVLVAGIGGVVVFQALRDGTGAASPAEAVDNVIEAVDNEDFLTIGESLVPNEREAAYEPTIDLLLELERLDVVEEGTSEDGVSGIDVTVTGVTPRIEPVTERIHWVTLDTGSITTITTPSELPAGDLVRDDVVNEPVETETTQLSEDPINFAVVEYEGDWYVSIYYSIAEQARRDAGKPIPNPAAAPQPVGSDSPEALMEDLAQQMSDLNAQGMLTLMDPEEFEAAYDYSSLYIPDAQADLEELRVEAAEEQVTWTVDSITSKTVERNGDTVVIITAAELTFVVEGETARVTWDGQCFRAEFDGEIESACRQDAIDEMGADDPASALINAEYGLRVVERDGRWYVAGYPSLVGGYVDGLESLTPAQLEALFSDESDGPGGIGGLFDEVEGITI